MWCFSILLGSGASFDGGAMAVFIGVVGRAPEATREEEAGRDTRGRVEAMLVVVGCWGPTVFKVGDK